MGFSIYQVSQVVVAVGVATTVGQGGGVTLARRRVFLERRLHDAEVHPRSCEVWSAEQAIGTIHRTNRMCIFVPTVLQSLAWEGLPLGRSQRDPCKCSRGCSLRGRTEGSVCIEWEALVNDQCENIVCARTWSQLGTRRLPHWCFPGLRALWQCCNAPINQITFFCE